MCWLRTAKKAKRFFRQYVYDIYLASEGLTVIHTNVEYVVWLDSMKNTVLLSPFANYSMLM